MASTDAATIWTELVAVSDRNPDATALSWPTGSMTYRELVRSASELAAQLGAIATVHDPIAIRCGNHPAAALVWLAAVRARLVPCLIHEQVEARDRAAIRETIGAVWEVEAIGIASADLMQGVTLEEIATGQLIRLDSPDVTADELPLPMPDEVVEISCTSGTTGVPKALSFTHSAHLYSRRCWIDHLRLSPDDVVFLFLPLAHAGGLRNSLLAALLSGARCHIVPGFAPARFWRDLNTSGATFFMFHEPSAAALLARDVDADEHRHLVRRACGAAGGVAVIESFERRFGIRTLQNYGLSETGSVTSPSLLQDPDLLAKLRRFSVDGTYVGEPLGSNTEIELRDSGGERQQGLGAAGEIWIRTPGACLESQHGDQGADGWVASGDLGVLGPHHSVHYIGRIADILLRRGSRVRLIDIDLAVRDLPGVRDAGSAILADGALRICVVPDATSGGCREEREDRVLQEAVRKAAPGSVVPDEVVVVETIPRNAMGRVVRARLR